MTCTCGLSICAVCNPACSCFDVFCGGVLTGTTCTPSVCVPVSGIPGGNCPGAAPHLCDLPLTNPGGAGSTNLEGITSPCNHGAVDMPPCPSATWACQCATRNGVGNGSGTAASQGACKIIGGGALARPSCSAFQSVGSLLNHWGTAFTSLLGRPKQYYTPVAGPSVKNSSIAPTSFGFFIILLIFGFIIWKLAFSER
jgi:hypothetical protein